MEMISISKHRYDALCEKEKILENLRQTLNRLDQESKYEVKEHGGIQFILHKDKDGRVVRITQNYDPERGWIWNDGKDIETIDFDKLSLELTKNTDYVLLNFREVINDLNEKMMDEGAKL